MDKKILIGIVGALVCLVASILFWHGISMDSEQHPEKAYVPGEVIVGFRKVSCTSSDAFQLIEKYGGEIKDVLPQINAVVVKVPAGKEKEFIEKISKEEIVKYAELNFKLER